MEEKKPINIEIGQYVKQCREAAGMTQEVFSDLVGLGPKHLSSIERGAAGLSLNVLRRMSQALSISADTLLFGLPDKEEQEKRALELQLISSRISRLPDKKFRVVKEIIDKLLEGMAME